VNALTALTPLIINPPLHPGLAMAEAIQKMDCAEENDEEQKENIVSWPQISW